MDALLCAALQEIAAEGPQGCRLCDLWKSLQNLSLSFGFPLDASVKQVTWNMLLSAGCLAFDLPHAGSVACNDPSIQSFEDAEKLNIRVTASEDFRECFLGSYDLRHCDAKLSNIQRLILERLGKARANGVTQYQIGKEFGISGNKLFYIIKSLETRGLVVRQSSIYRGERPIATNLIHLKRFAKGVKLGFQQRFEIQNSSTGGFDHDEGRDVIEGESSQSSSVTDVLINDDLPSLKAICEKLEEAENKVMVVSDLKMSLGYRYTRGHREWRRMLARLVAAGLVEAFDAKVENKVLSCIRLLKPFDIKAFTVKANNLNADEMSLEDKGTRRGKVTEQVAEVSINQQIYNTIKQEGSDGMTVTEIFRRLGINNRKNYFRLTEMIPKHGLIVQVENHKKSTQYRVWVPEESSNSRVTPENKHNQGPQTQFAREREAENEEIGAIVPMRTNVCSTGHLMLVDSDKTIEHRTLEQESNLVPSREFGSFEVDDEPPMPIRFAVPGGPSIVPHDSSHIAFSKCSQRTVALSTAHTQREIWIMEKLEKEKFIIRPELHKWLEDLEDRKDTTLDRRTVLRNLQKLQKEGRCKCILVNLPGVTNYGQIRTVEVVLLPSIEMTSDTMTEIYERHRAFDLMVRQQSSSRWRKSKSDENIPSLNGVQRTPKAEVVEKGGTLQDNGFIPAKLVRCRMLHQFLWTYISGLNDMNAHSEELSEPLKSGRTVFSLLVAIQSMPLELFLQVIGSTKHLKGLSERCRRGLRLSDLPRKESEALLDLNASGRLAWLVDILRRLKLLRIVVLPTVVKGDSEKRTQAEVAYALELNPYIDEPALEPPSTISVHVLNLGPSPRHYFKLSSIASLEEYWKSLEYFYRGSQSQIARRVFPGSKVPELFGPRSWSSLRVMSLEQRKKLHERIGLHDNRRVPYEECVKISRELNLSLDQVLGLSYEKNQKIKAQEMQASNSSSINIALGPRNTKKRRSSSTDSIPESVRLEITRRQHQLHEDNINFSTERPVPLEPIAKNTDNGNLRDSDDSKEDEDPSLAPNIVIRRFRPSRKRKYTWSDAADRVLIACYTRQRAILGARFNRVEWNAITGLPAAPDTCRRRMALLKLIPSVRKAMMALCNLLGTRYTKYLRSHADGPNVDNETSNTEEKQELEGKSSSSREYSWDDFEDPVLSAAINDIILWKNAVKSNSSKKSAEPASLCLQSSLPGRKMFPNLAILDSNEANNPRLSITDINDFSGYCATENTFQPKSIISHSTVFAKSSTARVRPNRSNVRNRMRRPITLKEFNSGEMVQKSVGAAMAVELIKSVFLNSAMESEVSLILVDALRRCKEADIFAAFRFLKDQAMVAVGDEGHAFVLSSKFYENATSSPFPLTTSDESKSLEAMLGNVKAQVDEDWVSLGPELQWGQMFHLFSRILAGDLSIAPFLPAKGIGERDSDEIIRKRKREIPLSEECHARKFKTDTGEEGGFGQRRERGFPGIEVKVHTAAKSLESMLMMNSESTIIDFYNSSPRGLHPANASKGTELLQDKALILCDPQHSDAVNEDRNTTQNWEHLNIKKDNNVLQNVESSIDLGFMSDHHEVPMLDQVYAAILSAGEEGKRIGDIIEVIKAEGKVSVEITESHARALHSLGLAREVMAFDHVRIVSVHYYEQYFLHLPKSDPASEGPPQMVPVLPWLKADGRENVTMRAALNRRIMGIVMLNPGILEESIIKQLDVLNPSSCQKLLQLMVLDGHLFVRTRMQHHFAGAPVLIQSILPQNMRQRKLVQKRHYYANPASSSLL